MCYNSGRTVPVLGAFGYSSLPSFFPDPIKTDYGLKKAAFADDTQDIKFFCHSFAKEGEKFHTYFPRWDGGFTMKSTAWFVVICAGILSAYAAENKSSTEPVEKATVVTEKDLTAQEARRQSSFKPPLRNIPSPGSEHGLVHEYPPAGYVPPSQSGGYSSHTSGGYGPLEQSGGYGAPPPANGYGSSYPSSGYGPSYPPSGSGYGSSHPSSGYSSSHPSSGYGSSHSSGGYGSSHPSSGYSPSLPSSGYSSSHPSSGYGPSYPSGGYGSPNPSSEYGPSYPASGYSLSHSANGHGSSLPSSGYGSPPASGGYGSAHPPIGYSAPYSSNANGYSPSHPSGGYGVSHPLTGYGLSHSSNSYNPSQPSSGYGAPPAHPIGYSQPHPSSGYAEYGPESIRDGYSPAGPNYSPPSSLSNGGYLKIGSAVHGGGSDLYGSPGARGYPKSPASYGGYDSHSQHVGSYRNKRKHASTEENYPSSYKNTGISDGRDRSPSSNLKRQKSHGHGGYTKAPLSSGGYSTQIDYNGRDKKAYDAYDKSPRGYSTYDKPASGYDKSPASYSQPIDQHDTYPKPGPKSYSKPSYDGYGKIPGSYSGYAKPTGGEGYDDHGKRSGSYSPSSGTRDGYAQPEAKYAGYKKPAGSAGGASQYDGGYGGYATGPPARGFGDYSKVPPKYPEPTGYRPSISSGQSLSQSPGNDYRKAYGKVTQSGYSKAYDTYSAGTPNLGGYEFGSDSFTRRGLLGDHGLYGLASYGRNYGGNRYNDLENKVYSADQSIYGGYHDLY